MMIQGRPKAAFYRGPGGNTDSVAPYFYRADKHQNDTPGVPGNSQTSEPGKTALPTQ